MRSDIVLMAVSAAPIDAHAVFTKIAEFINPAARLCLHRLKQLKAEDTCKSLGCSLACHFCHPHRLIFKITLHSWRVLSCHLFQYSGLIICYVEGKLGALVCAHRDKPLRVTALRRVSHVCLQAPAMVDAATYIAKDSFTASLEVRPCSLLDSRVVAPPSPGLVQQEPARFGAPVSKVVGMMDFAKEKPHINQASCAIWHGGVESSVECLRSGVSNVLS